MTTLSRDLDSYLREELSYHKRNDPEVRGAWNVEGMTERPVWLKGGERAGAEMAGEARGWKLCRRWSLGFYTKHDEKIFWQQRRDTS